MATTITLDIKNAEGVVNKEQKHIERIKGYQYEEIMMAINNIITEVQQDQSLSDLFKGMFGIEGEGTENLDDMELLEVAKKMAGSFEILLVKMPSHAFKILSILAELDVQTLKNQDFFAILDIYDAVIEENDMERLIERLKKSIALTQAKVKFQGFLGNLRRNKNQQ